MNYFEKKFIVERIKEDIDSIKEYDDVEQFISANFQQFTTHGEYDDNSLDLSYDYKMLKDIEADPDFENKLNFILSKYVRCKKTK